MDVFVSSEFFAGGEFSGGKRRALRLCRQIINRRIDNGSMPCVLCHLQATECQEDKKLILITASL